MKYHYTITMDDLLHFNIYHMGSTKGFQSQLRLFRIFLPIFFFLFALFFYLLDPTIWLPSLISIAFGLNYLVRGRTILENRYWKNAKTLLGAQQNKGMIGEQSLEVKEEEVIEENPYRRIHHRKDFLNEIQEDENFIYLYISSMQAIMVPKNVLGSEKEGFLEKIQSFVSIEE
jgi:hypothetical protein